MILHSKIYGQGQALLILHGLFGMGDNWATLGKRWAESYEVHLIDLRNHGKSFHSDQMNYSLLSEDLLKYIAHYGLSDLILIGHSMGGKATMRFAINHPEVAQKIIVVDIAPKAYQPHHQEIIRTIKAVDFDRIATREDLDTFLAQFISHWDTRALISKNVYRKEDGQFAFRFHLFGIEKNYAALIEQPFQDKSYEKPALFLRGAQSHYVSDEDTPLIKKHFPLAQIVTLDEAGHWIHVDRPMKFYDETQAFLNSY